MKPKYFFLLFFFPAYAFSQYVLPNEDIIFSFSTSKGKKMVLVKDKENQYIQYRYGKPKRIEMEFPKERTAESWSKFQYNSGFRSGGKENFGLEIDNLRFTNDDFEYLIYRTYFASTEYYSTGIIVKKDGKGVRITGKYNTITGSICCLEENTLLKKEHIGLRF